MSLDCKYSLYRRSDGYCANCTDVCTDLDDNTDAKASCQQFCATFLKTLAAGTSSTLTSERVTSSGRTFTSTEISNLPSGNIAAIVIGVIVAVVLVGLCIYAVYLYSVARLYFYAMNHLMANIDIEIAEGQVQNPMVSRTVWERAFSAIRNCFTKGPVNRGTTEKEGQEESSEIVSNPLIPSSTNHSNEESVSNKPAAEDDEFLQLIPRSSLDRNEDFLEGDVTQPGNTISHELSVDNKGSNTQNEVEGEEPPPGLVDIYMLDIYNSCGHQDIPSKSASNKKTAEESEFNPLVPGSSSHRIKNLEKYVTAESETFAQSEGSSK